MTKIDLHLHCTRTPVPRTDKGFVSTAAEMVPHPEELGIEKAVLLSAGETGGMMACNEDLWCICEEDPAHFAWMCNLDPVEPDTIRQRLARYKARGGRVPALFEKYPNLYGDLSANSAGCALMRDPAFGLAFVERYAHRLFFATDMVNTEMVFPLGAWLDRQVAEGRLSRAAYESVCRKNAERVFGL